MGTKAEEDAGRRARISGMALVAIAGDEEMMVKLGDWIEYRDDAGSWWYRLPDGGGTESFSKAVRAWAEDNG